MPRMQALPLMTSGCWAIPEQAVPCRALWPLFDEKPFIAPSELFFNFPKSVGHTVGQICPTTKKGLAFSCKSLNFWLVQGLKNYHNTLILNNIMTR
jgi:hypothetical protein